MVIVTLDGLKMRSLPFSGVSKTINDSFSSITSSPTTVTVWQTESPCTGLGVAGNLMTAAVRGS